MLRFVDQRLHQLQRRNGAVFFLKHGYVNTNQSFTDVGKEVAGAIGELHGYIAQCRIHGVKIGVIEYGVKSNIIANFQRILVEYYTSGFVVQLVTPLTVYAPEPTGSCPDGALINAVVLHLPGDGDGQRCFFALKRANSPGKHERWRLSRAGSQSNL